MRIGINCLEIDPTFLGGVNTFTLGLLKGLKQVGQKHQFQLFISEYNKHLFTGYKDLPNFEIFVLSFKKNYFQKGLRELASITHSQTVFKYINNFLYSFLCHFMDTKSDIVYIPTTVLFPYSYKKPTLISMHDIQHFHYPEYFSWRDLRYRKLIFGISIDSTSYIQASSNFIKQDLLAHFTSLKPEQVVIIQEGVDIETFSNTNESDQTTLKKYSLPENFLFCPAQLWKHKNHITILKALKKIELEEGIIIPLILVGGKFSASKEIFNFIESNHMKYIIYLGKVPFEDLIFLYKKAKYVITAVLYESSSLPILESAASGTPIIASKIPPNQEMAHKLKLNLFTPQDEYELASLILKIWNDEELISKQVSHNNESINYYSWDNVAKKYIEFIEGIY